MKRVLFSILCVLSVSFAAYSQDYYWNQGKKVLLQRGDQQYILFKEAGFTESYKLYYIGEDKIVYFKTLVLKWGITKPDVYLGCSENILYQAPSYKTGPKTNDMYLTHRFYVKLRSEGDSVKLKDLADQYKAEIEKKHSVPLWYVLRWTPNSEYNALELANIFYETGMFAASEPEFGGIAFPASNQGTPNQGGLHLTPTRKTICDGQILITRGGDTYDTQGKMVK